MNNKNKSKERVLKNTPEKVNEMIWERTKNSVRYFAHHPEKIPNRLRELDDEWDIERMLEANAASFSILGVLLSAKISRKWMILPMAVGTFLLQHSLQGWCPPLPVFRRMGVRTKGEIDIEKVALKILQGKGLSLKTRIKKA
ncbi:MAG TPA: hypothetical protein PLU24_03720, partial [Candidatus Omnitrophota bacterium]|nr:hypothetical protein [Candidatus Omnitrophota bacterium]